MTTVPRDRPDIILFLTGKCFPLGGIPGTYSVITVPRSSIVLMSFSFSEGYTRSIPHPRTAIVCAPTERAPRAHIESIPEASPETTIAPAEESSAPSLYAILAPLSEHFLVPTSANKTFLSTSGNLPL